MFNWNKFIRQCHTLSEWTTAAGGTGASGPLHAVIAILRGETVPEIIAAQTLTGRRLSNLDAGRDAPAGIEMPQAIRNIICEWINDMPREVSLIGRTYEQLSSGRRAQGLFYTPPEVIDFILFHTVKTCDIVCRPKVKVLDPACGAGHFLIRAYDVLRDKFLAARETLIKLYPEQDWSDDGIHRHILRFNLWGADIDSSAAEIARAGLVLKRPSCVIETEPNILAGDSLKRPQQGQIHWFWGHEFDYVIGNPPYVSHGLRGTGQMPRDYADFLRREFKETAQYKLSFYPFFIQRGIEVLQPGGRLGFILPDTFLQGRYYSKVRRYILDHALIDSLCFITAPVFKSASTGHLVICLLTKKDFCSKKAHKDHIVSVRRINGSTHLEAEGCCAAYSQQYFETIEHNRFRIFFDLKIKDLIDKIDKNGQPLRNFASGHTGVRSLSRQRDIVATEPGGPTWRRGLISGGQVQRYSLDYQGHWINVDPRLLYKGGWNADIVGRRKILLRQTGDCLTACIDENGLYHLNNIHSFVLKNNDITLEYLLLLLNSRLFTFYYRAVSQEYRRRLAQIDIEMVEALPVRKDDVLNQKAPALVAAMQCRSGQTPEDYIDEQIYRIYGLTDSEIGLIKNYEDVMKGK